MLQLEASNAAYQGKHIQVSVHFHYEYSDVRPVQIGARQIVLTVS